MAAKTGRPGLRPNHSKGWGKSRSISSFSGFVSWRSVAVALPPEFSSITGKSNISTAGIVVVGLALVCSVIVVFLAERAGQGAPAGQTGDNDFDPLLDDLYRNIRQSAEGTQFFARRCSRTVQNSKQVRHCGLKGS